MSIDKVIKRLQLAKDLKEDLENNHEWYYFCIKQYYRKHHSIDNIFLEWFLDIYKTGHELRRRMEDLDYCFYYVIDAIMKYENEEKEN